MAKVITLVGMKHCGKSSVGKIIAARLGLPFADTDSLLERTAGKSARELFIEGGAALMAQAETAACDEALKIAKEGGVISTGGAFCDNSRAVALLRPKSIFCLIDAGFEVLYGRILKSAEEEGEMPAFLRGENPKEEFLSIYRARAEKYRKMADISAESFEGSSPEGTARAILHLLAAREALIP